MPARADVVSPSRAGPAAGDDEAHGVEGSKVGGRIAVDDQRVGGVARLQPAELAGAPQQRRAGGGGGAQGIEVREPELGQQPDLADDRGL